MVRGALAALSVVVLTACGPTRSEFEEEAGSLRCELALACEESDPDVDCSEAQGLSRKHYCETYNPPAAAACLADLEEQLDSEPLSCNQPQPESCQDVYEWKQQRLGCGHPFVPDAD